MQEQFIARAKLGKKMSYSDAEPFFSPHRQLVNGWVGVKF